MALVQISPPPGFRFHGTDLESEGRWRDGSLVRWRDGSLRPVGGWVDRIGSAAYNAAPRGMLGWEANGSTRWIAAGTYNKLYATTGLLRARNPSDRAVFRGDDMVAGQLGAVSGGVQPV